jgi:tetratricopeptide (TPR) repeat protein
MKELQTELKSKIEQMIASAMDVFSLEKPEESTTLLLNAWVLLPDEKQLWTESFLLSKYILHVYYRTGNLPKAKEWSVVFLNCDHAQRNYGEAEMMAGKIAHQEGNITLAKQHFSVANQKSQGRCFSGDDKQYKKLLDKSEVRPASLKALLVLASKELAAKKYSVALSLYYDCLNHDLLNPLVHLNKGICHFELNEPAQAADSFTRVYMLEGEAPFRKIDAKYFEFLKTKIQI